MILNMSYGASEAQIFDFTFSQDIDSTTIQTGLELNIPQFTKAGIKGFFFYPTGTPGEINGNVQWIYSDYYSNSVTEGTLYFSYYRSYDSSFSLSHNTNSNAFEYNGNTKILQVRTNMGGLTIKAGSYRLVIW